MKPLVALPMLETPRLELRPWTTDLLNIVTDIYADEEAARYIGGQKPAWQAWRHKAMILGHHTLRGYCIFAIVEKNSQKPVGWCGPWCPEGWPEPELSYALHPSAQGKGYATEAGRAALAWMFTALGWPTAISLIDVHNTASKRVAEHLGARFERDATLFDELPAELWRYPDATEWLAAHG